MTANYGENFLCNFFTILKYRKNCNEMWTEFEVVASSCNGQKSETIQCEKRQMETISGGWKLLGVKHSFENADLCEIFYKTEFLNFKMQHFQALEWRWIYSVGKSKSNTSRIHEHWILCRFQFEKKSSICYYYKDQLKNPVPFMLCLLCSLIVVQHFAVQVFNYLNF